MRFRSSKGFSLIEVLITVTILSTAIVFIFRSFIAELSGARFSRNITLACLLAEAKLWEAGQRQKQAVSPLGIVSGKENIGGGDFNWYYQCDKIEDPDLIEAKSGISWKENSRQADYSMEFLTYLMP